jgi:RimJ/RimL family protein N-acetyltransferase
VTPFWDDRVAPWVARHIPGCERGFGPSKSLGVLSKDRKLAGGLVFHNWHPECGVIEMSAASVDPRAWSRTVMTEAFGYAFSHCQLVVIRCAPENGRVRKFWRALGANEYEIPRLRGRDKSEVIMTLTDDAWAKSKYRRDPNGQSVTAAAS